MTFEPRVSRRGKGYFAEIALARGPRVMAVTGGGTFEELFGYAWLAILDRRERRLRLFQAQVGGSPWPIGGDPAAAEWVEVPVPDLVHAVEEVRHLALAFDQAARHVVAYERKGEVWVRQWDPVRGEYVMRGPWPGVDPVLVMDATVGYHVPDSDVLLFHLTPDRKALVMRVQRELYGTAHTVETFAEEAILDQGVALPYQFELLGSLASDPDGTGLALRSDLYPVQDGVALRFGVTAPQHALYRPVTVAADLGYEAFVVNVAAPSSGEYSLAVLQVSLAHENLGFALTAPAGGVYASSVPGYEITGEEPFVKASILAPSRGSYTEIAQFHGGTNAIGARVSPPAGGEYASA